MSVFLDTNILIYSICTDLADEPKRQAALALLDRDDCVLSVQVFQEFFVQATRKSRAGALTHEQASGLIAVWRRFSVIENTLAILDAALALHARTCYSLWDCSIICAAQNAGCRILYSEDLSHGQVIADVKIVNPFRD